MERLEIEPEHAAELSRLLDAALDRPPSARAVDRFIAPPLRSAQAAAT
jgi:hypothetical protein